MDYINNKMSSLSIKIGFWSALLFTLSAVAYGASAGIFFSIYPMPVWTDIHAYACFMNSSSQKLFSLCQAMAFLAGPLFILLLCSIHDFAQEEKKILTRIGLCLSTIFVTLASMCYFVQFTILPQSIASGQLGGLDQLVELNTLSFMTAMVVLGWGMFFGLTTLFIAPVFCRGKLQKVIKWSLVFTGAFCILDAAGFMFQSTMLSIVSTMIFNTTMIVACIALCILFKRLEHSGK